MVRSGEFSPNRVKNSFREADATGSQSAPFLAGEANDEVHSHRCRPSSAFSRLAPGDGRPASTGFPGQANSPECQAIQKTDRAAYAWDHPAGKPGSLDFYLQKYSGGIERFKQFSL
jgi:hypothetical protein